MSVKVPINKPKKSKRRFTSREQFGKLQEIPSDRQFLKDVVDQDRLITRFATDGGQALPFTLISFIVPNGQTYYSLESFYDQDAVTVTEVDIVLNGVVLESMSGSAVGRTTSSTPIFNLAGNGIKTIDIIVNRFGSADIAFSLIGYLENSVRT